jgi:hypothetical protein
MLDVESPEVTKESASGFDGTVALEVPLNGVQE